MKRKGVTYAQLAEKLAAMDIHETERNLNNKISRGGGIQCGVLVAMPRGGWLGNLASALVLAGVVLALTAIGYGIILEHWSEKNEVYYNHKEAAERQRQQSAQKIAESCQGRTGTDMLSCLQEQIATHDREQGTSHDLQAQQEMALWGLWVFIAAAFTALLTSAGVYLIWQTLEATRIAADHTKGMLDEAKKTTAAAEATVAETRRIGEAQVRAYLTATRASLSAQEETGAIAVPRLHLCVHNSGATPAVNVSYFCQASLTEQFSRHVLPDLPMVPFDQYLGNVPSGVEHSFDSMAFGLALVLRDFDQAMLKTDNSATPLGKYPLIVLHGVIFYDDVFGHSYQSMFGFLMNDRDELGSLEVIQAPIPAFEQIADRKQHVAPKDH